MFNFLYATTSTSILTALLIIILIVILLESFFKNEQATSFGSFPEPPTPRSFPIIGHLHLLSGYSIPYQAFTDLGKKYGSVLKLKLGAVNSVVINGQDSIREVLITKGHHFDSRPNFERYQQLFGGNKENSLAFCDWSEKQRIRREMLKAYTFPRAFSNKFATLTDIVNRASRNLNAQIPNGIVDIKPLILRSCANIFTNHFCSKDFTLEDRGFIQMIEEFDEIFYEVNQGYAADFLPFLLPLHYNNLAKMKKLTHSIRNFIVKNIIANRYDNFTDEEPSDYVESLIHYVKNDESCDLDWNCALFALEDIIGGHSAVGNFLVKLLGFLVKEPNVQACIQKEIDSVTCTDDGFRQVSILDRTSMPYTEATIFEAIRLIASPIVPRVANQETSINGFRVEKNTLVFLNNYDLSMSDKLWDEPGAFKPERFIVKDRLVKPEHFLPFGGGRRSCMGYKMVQLVGFGLLSGLLQHFNILPAENEVYNVPIGSLALPKNTFNFKFVRR